MRSARCASEQTRDAARRSRRRKRRSMQAVRARRLANEHVRHAVRRPFLRVQPEVAVLEGDDGRALRRRWRRASRRCRRSRPTRPRSKHGRPLVKRQPRASSSATAPLALERRSHGFAFAGASDDDGCERRQSSHDRQRPVERTAVDEPAPPEMQRRSDASGSVRATRGLRRSRRVAA